MADNTRDTPAQLQARQQVQALLRDPQFRKQYYDATAPGHMAAVRRLAELMQAGDPSPGADHTRRPH